MKHTLLAIAAGILSGLLALASLSGASIAVFYLSLVHPLPLFYVGLSLGVRASTIATASAVLMVMVANPLSGLMFAALYAAPVWLMIRLSLIGPQGPIWHRAEDDHSQRGETIQNNGWFSPGYVLAVVVAMAGAYILVGSLLAGGGLQDTISKALTELSNAIAAPQGKDVLQQAVLALVPFFPGLAAGMWAVVLVLNALIAQGLLARAGRNLRPSPRLRDLVLPDALSWAWVGAALVALVAPGELGYLGRNLVFVLAVPFFFLGLSVVHKLAGLTRFPGALLGMVYVVMLFSGWFVLVIATLGILEQWVGLKKRMEPST